MKLHMSTEGARAAFQWQDVKGTPPMGDPGRMERVTIIESPPMGLIEQIEWGKQYVGTTNSEHFMDKPPGSLFLIRGVRAGEAVRAVIGSIPPQTHPKSISWAGMADWWQLTPPGATLEGFDAP
jgi:hypothetical protein